MRVTEASRVRRRNIILLMIIIKVEGIEEYRFLNRVINRCPAIILAINRTARVPGRIIFLIVSIITIKDIRAIGVPWGTRWVNMC